MAAQQALEVITLAAFTKESSGGNLAAVVLLDNQQDFDDGDLQRLAKCVPRLKDPSGADGEAERLIVR